MPIGSKYFVLKIKAQKKAADPVKTASGPAVIFRRSDLLDLQSRNQGLCVNQFQILYHLLRALFILQEMRRLQVALVSGAVGIDLKNGDFVGRILLGCGIKGEHARLQPHGSFYFLLQIRIVFVQPACIDSYFR